MEIQCHFDDLQGVVHPDWHTCPETRQDPRNSLDFQTRDLATQTTCVSDRQNVSHLSLVWYTEVRNLALLRVHTEHWKWFYMTFQDLFMCIFQDFSGPFMSTFHVFQGLLNRVDIEQVRFSYNTEYVTQFITILNNRSNGVWQWTMITYVKAENMYMGKKCGNHLVYFPWLSRRGKFWILNSMTFWDLYTPWLLLQDS